MDDSGNIRNNIKLHKTLAEEIKDAFEHNKKIRVVVLSAMGHHQIISF